jgi:hypothetical membrane protein
LSAFGPLSIDMYLPALPSLGRDLNASASALLGVLQYAIGAVAAPLVGVFGAKTALPMPVVMATFGFSALEVFVLLVRGSRSRTSITDANS